MSVARWQHFSLLALCAHAPPGDPVVRQAVRQPRGWGPKFCISKILPVTQMLLSAHHTLNPQVIRICPNVFSAAYRMSLFMISVR